MPRRMIRRACGMVGERRPCERRTRLRSSSVCLRSARTGGCSRAATTAISLSRKARMWRGGTHHEFVKRASAARASEDHKHSGLRSPKAPAGAINEAHTRGQMRLHRGNARRKTVAEPTEEVVGRAHLCGGAGAGARAATKRHRLGCGFSGSHGRQEAR